MIHRCIVVLLGSSISLNARAASSVLVWPIFFKTISASDKGSELWLEKSRRDGGKFTTTHFSVGIKKNLKIFMPIKNDVVSSPPVRQCSAGDNVNLFA